MYINVGVLVKFEDYVVHSLLHITHKNIFLKNKKKYKNKTTKVTLNNKDNFLSNFKIM